MKARKKKKPKVKVAEPVQFSTVDSAAAPAPKREILGLTSETSSGTTGKSASCASGHRSLSISACREHGGLGR